MIPCFIKVLNQFSSFWNSPWAGSGSGVTNQPRWFVCLCRPAFEHAVLPPLLQNRLQCLKIDLCTHTCTPHMHTPHAHTHTQLQALRVGFMHLWGAERTFITPFIQAAPFLSKGHKNQFADLNLAKSFRGGAQKPPKGVFYDQRWVTVTLWSSRDSLCYC